MKTLRTIGTVAVTGAILALAPMGSAMADTTNTTFVLTAGVVSLETDGSAVLTGGAVGIASATGSLGDVEVSDLRGGELGWTLTATSDVFSEPGAGGDSTAVDYATGTITEVGTVTTDAVDTSDVTANVVVTATAVVGNHTATFTPSLTVELPGDATAGTYSGVVTTSLT